MQLLAISV